MRTVYRLRSSPAVHHYEHQSAVHTCACVMSTPLMFTPAPVRRPHFVCPCLNFRSPQLVTAPPPPPLPPCRRQPSFQNHNIVAPSSLPRAMSRQGTLGMGAGSPLSGQLVRLRTVSLFGGPLGRSGSSQSHALLSGSGSLFGTGIGRAVAVLYGRAAAAAAAAGTQHDSIAEELGGPQHGEGALTGCPAPLTSGTGEGPPFRAVSLSADTATTGHGGALKPRGGAPPLRAVLLVGSAENGPALRMLPRVLELPLLAAIRQAIAPPPQPRQPPAPPASTLSGGTLETMATTLSLTSRSLSLPSSSRRGVSHAAAAAAAAAAAGLRSAPPLLLYDGSPPQHDGAARDIMHLDGVGLVSRDTSTSSVGSDHAPRHPARGSGDDRAARHHPSRAPPHHAASSTTAAALLASSSSQLLASSAPPPAPLPALPVVELLLRGLNERQVQQVDGLLALLRFLQERHHLTPLVEYT